MNEKLERLRELIRGYGRAAVAFSSGVDSAFLLAVAHEVLSDDAAAVSAEAPIFPRRESEEARVFCEERGIRRIVVTPDLLSIRAFAENPPNRCYHCKRMLMIELIRAARMEGFGIVLDGTNADDPNGHRPGMRALAELGITSPLLEAGLTKAEIRALSKEMGLRTWDKPAYACLATRFPHGESVTEEGLRAVESAEELLFRLGLRQLRVRKHGELARIEAEPSDFPVIAENRSYIASGLRRLGFRYVSLDLDGFRSGSMDPEEPLPD